MTAKALGSRAIIGEFYNRLEVDAGASWVSAVAMRMQSDQESETYKWLGMAPALREWVGGRNAKGLRDNGLTIVNKTFEATLDIPVDWLRRDKTGQIMARIAELAGRAVTHDASLVSTLILNGATGLCYDGQYFFDTDHAEGDNTTSQSNKITFDISDAGTGGTTTAPTASTMSRAIMAGVAQMLAFKDDQNEPMNEMAQQFAVMVGPSLMPTALAALSAPVVESGGVNVILAARNFQISPVINARLSSWTDKFAIFRTDGATKPFIVQEEEALSVQAIAEGSEEEVKNNRHLYGIKKIGNAGYGYWQHACQVTLQA